MTEAELQMWKMILRQVGSIVRNLGAIHEAISKHISSETKTADPNNNIPTRQSFPRSL
jgi:hypothetical protein